MNWNSHGSATVFRIEDVGTLRIRVPAFGLRPNFVHEDPSADTDA